MNVKKIFSIIMAAALTVSNTYIPVYAEEIENIEESVSETNPEMDESYNNEESVEIKETEVENEKEESSELVIETKSEENSETLPMTESQSETQESETQESVTQMESVSEENTETLTESRIQEDNTESGAQEETEYVTESESQEGTEYVTESESQEETEHITEDELQEETGDLMESELQEETEITDSRETQEEIESSLEDDTEETMEVNYSDSKEDVQVEGDYEYRVEDNGEVTITDYLRGYDLYFSKLTIPSEIGGKKVTGIGTAAFAEQDIPYIKIPEGIKHIGEKAFFQATYQPGYRNNYVILPASIEDIGSSALYNVNVYYEGTQDEWEKIAIGEGNGYQLGENWIPTCLNAHVDETINYIYTEEGEKITLVGFIEEVNNGIIPSKVDGKQVTNIGSEITGFGRSYTEIPEGITHIDEGALTYCETVYLPKSIVYIGDNAFSSLSTLYYRGTEEDWEKVRCNTYINEAQKYFGSSDGVYVYKDFLYKEEDGEIVITGLENTYGSQTRYIPNEILGKKVTRIGDSAFPGCTFDIRLPEGIISIGDSAFSGCTGNITLSEGIISIGDSAFFGCKNLEKVTFSEKMTSIGNSAFSGCTGLKNIDLPKGLTAIGDSTFSGCRNLEKVTFPEKIMSIGENAFFNCKILKKVYYEGTEENWKKITIGNGNESLLSAKIYYPSEYNNFICQEDNGEITIVEYVGNEDKIIIPSMINGKKVTHIGDHAGFYNEEIYLPKSIISIGDGAFSGCIIYYEGTEEDWQNIVKGYHAPYYSQKITDDKVVYCEKDGEIVITNYFGKESDIVIPSNIEGKQVTSIRGWAFSSCNNLESITLPDSVTSIGAGAFSSCNNLESIALPDSLTKIEYSLNP